MFLVRKQGGPDHGKPYAMKVLKKSWVAKRSNSLQYTQSERRVLELVRGSPFLSQLHYAFQTDETLHLVLG